MPTPDKVQWVSYPGRASSDTPQWHIRYPNATESGDTLIISGQMGSSSNLVSTIVDDQGGSLAGGQWVLVKFQGNATDNQGVAMYRRTNCPAGVRDVLVTMTANGFSNWEGILLNNLDTSASPLDGTPAGGTPTGTSLAAGNITTSTANTFWVSKMACTSLDVISNPTTFSAPANYAIYASNGTVYETTCMFGTQASSGTFNPAITSSRSLTRTAMVTAAFKTASSGGTPNVTRAEVRFMMVVQMSDPSTKFTPGTSITFMVPCPSVLGVNCLAIAFDDSNGIYGTSPASKTSSSPTNTWTSPVAVQCGNPANGAWAGFVVAENASVSATGTVTLSSLTTPPDGSSAGFVLFVFGIANAGGIDTSRFGNDTLVSVPPVTINNALDTAIATSQNNEVVLVFTQEERQTPTNITASSGTAKIMMPDISIYEGIEGCHDSGIAILDAANAGNYNFNVSFSDYEGGLTVEKWAVTAIAIKSALIAAPQPSATPMARRFIGWTA